ncbi:hypothetical protein [Pseudoduganella armeniaca]|uniref:Uncharacterized protein n=1 Tax=Pseudoduganella armeniaca TaxID=2072590 RepID=A0A2R4CGT7_9BURK|nr:hypothetical protein [Pseudoduganella armeniaca]AVR98805.1 hypothetical protein C9I28_26595 [Pseudoduganella armeniaca]
MNNIVVPIWAAAYVIVLQQAFMASRSEIWIFVLMLVFVLPVMLLNYLKGSAASRPLRAALVVMQLAFALMMYFRHAMAATSYLALVALYLAVSAVITVLLRRKFPEDIYKF